MIKLILIICGIICFVGLILLGARLYFRLPVLSYYKNSQKSFKIPDINNGFVAQGIDYDDKSNLFLCTGYKTDGSTSPLYLINKETNKLEKTLYLCYENGEHYCGHSGGLCLFNNKLYVADDMGLIVYDYESILNTNDQSNINAIGKFSTKISDEDNLSVAFVSSNNNQLFVGEFYKEKDYETPLSHRLTLKSGEQSNAIMLCYDFDETTKELKKTPSTAYSIPNMVQGVCFGDNNIYVSTSWGLSFSNIFAYDQTKLTLEKENFEVLGTTIPLYSLNSTNLKATKKIAPMSEEIVIVDNFLYTMCESASNKYIFGKLTSSQYCYKTTISFFEK